jgi:hypothetical protein
MIKKQDNELNVTSESFAKARLGALMSVSNEESHS